LAAPNPPAATVSGSVCVREGGETPGFYGMGRRIPWYPDWLAEEVVSSEPVSTPNSLLNRERTGNFGELAVNRRHITSNLLDFSIGYEANSLTIGTGNFWQETGKQCG
jgi:hypothetical protein